LAKRRELLYYHAWKRAADLGEKKRIDLKIQTTRYSRVACHRPSVEISLLLFCLFRSRWQTLRA
jgi:hypothetical protein